MRENENKKKHVHFNTGKAATKTFSYFWKIFSILAFASQLSRWSLYMLVILIFCVWGDRKWEKIVSKSLENNQVQLNNYGYSLVHRILVIFDKFSSPYASLLQH